MTFTAILPACANFSMSDLTYRYAKETPGAEFMRDRYFRAVLTIAGASYTPDDWEITDNGDGTQTVKVYLYLIDPALHEVKVRYENGDEIVTRMYGTREEICSYYRPGKIFNIGSTCDNMQRVACVEILK